MLDNAISAIAHSIPGNELVVYGIVGITFLVAMWLKIRKERRIKREW